MFQQRDSEQLYEAWGRFERRLGKDFYSCIPKDQIPWCFYYGLNAYTKRLVDDESMKRGGLPFLSWKGDDAHFLLEDMANYSWYLSTCNAQEHQDPLEDLAKAFEEEPMGEDFLLYEEPMEQKFEEPSFSEEVAAAPQEAEECEIPMSLLPQPTPNFPKIHPPRAEFSIPFCGEFPSFVDYRDTWLLIFFKMTYNVAESPRVVDYATLHGRKPLFEHFP